MNTKLIILAIASFIGFSAQAQLGKVVAKGKEITKPRSASSGGLTSDEVVSGLKEALSRGAKTASESASLTNGFYKNSLIFIPFPPEAQKMKDKLVALGMQKKVTEFEESINRAAEEASKDAYLKR